MYFSKQNFNYDLISTETDLTPGCKSNFVLGFFNSFSFTNLQIVYCIEVKQEISMGIFDKLFGSKKNIEIERSKNSNFISSDELMDEEKFWSIIKRTKDSSENNFELQQEELANELRKLTPHEVILFGNRFRSYRGLTNTWELWGAIYIIQGGCGDDSFNDFREWVIGQGKDFYNKTIKNPETLVEVETEKIEDADWEGLGYIPGTVFEELTGQKMPYSFQENHNTTGTEWKEEGDDLKNLFPLLYAKYQDNI